MKVLNRVWVLVIMVILISVLLTCAMQVVDYAQGVEGDRVFSFTKYLTNVAAGGKTMMRDFAKNPNGFWQELTEPFRTIEHIDDFFKAFPAAFKVIGTWFDDVDFLLKSLNPMNAWIDCSKKSSLFEPYTIPDHWDVILDWEGVIKR